jgi:uncharacterized protein (TIGR02145 family)
VFDCAFSAGSTTGATATFVDPRDGKNYKTVVMPDGRTWFAQNLNYTKDLTYNDYAYEANGKQFTSLENGVPAIGSYWCPALYFVSSKALPSATSGSQGDCNVYGALYTWETVMMVDGKYADEMKTSTAWDETWVSFNYFPLGTAPAAGNNSDRNNARGGAAVKGGGRGICPAGWHVPTDYEWANLLNEVEGNNTYTKQTGNGWWGTDAGQKLKSAATFTNTDPGDGSWLAHANTNLNTCGFALVPAGVRNAATNAVIDRGIREQPHASSVCTNRTSYARSALSYMMNTSRVARLRADGGSVRCVKD